MSRPAFARSGQSNPFGKLGPNLGALRLGFKTEEALRREAARAHMPLMEWVRHYLELRLHGRATVERTITVTLDQVEGCNPTATEGQR